MKKSIGYEVRKYQTMKTHVYVHIGNWQSYQFQQLKQNLPSGWAVIVMDFATNRLMNYQDEIKSAFFGQKQLTLHPSVIYYNQGEKVNHLSHVFVSDDIKQDFHSSLCS